MDNGYSLADLAAATNGGNFAGNEFIWIFALLILFGGGGFGWNRGDYGQFATAASQQEILFGQQFQGLDNKIDRLGNGIADATFSLNNSIKDGNAMVAGRVVDEGRGIQMQIADGLCKTQGNVDALRFDMSNYHSDTNAVTIAQTQKILDALAQNKIDSLQAQVSELKTQNMFCGIPRINPYGYGVYPYQGCGCGCNGFGGYAN